MNKITDYHIIFCKDLDYIETMVKIFIEKGWQPYGFLSLGSENSYIQCMIKYAEATDENKNHDYGETTICKECGKDKLGKYPYEVCVCNDN